MKIGITGHQRVENISDWAWVESALSESIKKFDKPLLGITSLAIGSDQIFAKVILDFSGSLWVVLPFEGYENIFQNGIARKDYLLLLKRAEKVETLGMKKNKEESYLAAGKRIVDLADVMIAVWNGKQASGLGGTADVVEYTKRVGKKIIHLNPIEKTCI